MTLSFTLGSYQIAIFYLVLRGLDTVEDDMSIPLEKKARPFGFTLFCVACQSNSSRLQLPELRNFYKNLNIKGWNISGYGDNKDERDLLEQFHLVIEVFLGLKPTYCLLVVFPCRL